MAWIVEYGPSRKDGYWYWRLVNREYDPPFIAATGGGGHATLQDCSREIQVAKHELWSALVVQVEAF